MSTYDQLNACETCQAGPGQPCHVVAYDRRNGYRVTAQVTTRPHRGRPAMPGVIRSGRRAGW